MLVAEFRKQGEVTPVTGFWRLGMKYFREMEMGVFISGSQASQAFCYRALLVLSWVCLFSSVFLRPHSFTSLQASAQNDSLSVSKGIFLSSLIKIATHLLPLALSCFIFLNGTYHTTWNYIFADFWNCLYLSCAVMSESKFHEFRLDVLIYHLELSWHIEITH